MYQGHKRRLPKSTAGQKAHRSSCFSDHATPPCDISTQGWESLPARFTMVSPKTLHGSGEGPVFFQSDRKPAKVYSLLLKGAPHLAFPSPSPALLPRRIAMNELRWPFVIGASVMVSQPERRHSPLANVVAGHKEAGDSCTTGENFPPTNFLPRKPEVSWLYHDK